jgi:GTP-binding protein LepA
VLIPDRVSGEVEEIVSLTGSDAIRASAKSGIGIPEILERIVQKSSASR